MTDDLERLLEMAQDYNDPPEPPGDEMWAAIRKELLQGRGSDDDLDELSVRRAVRARGRFRRWTPWAIGLAAAATLAVGFGLGRLTDDAAGPSGPVAATVPGSAAPSLAVRLATAEHMSNAEALLTMFRAGDPSEDEAATAEWARDLLSTTRLLLDSRVADDPEMARLLADLELVLVQIASASGDDNDLIEDGIQRQQLLAKLRTAAAPADISL